MNDLPKISVMSLQPDDVLVFSTVDKLSAEVYHRVEQKIINWKKDSNINNKHLLLTSALELKVLRQKKEIMQVDIKQELETLDRNDFDRTNILVTQIMEDIKETMGNDYEMGMGLIEVYLFDLINPEFLDLGEKK
jgi:hypothetical protein